MPDNPSTSTSRRSVMAVGVCSLVSVAGCAGLASDVPMLDLLVYNQTDSRYIVTIRVYREEGDRARSEARVFQSQIEVEPQGVARREAVAESQQYLIRYDVDRIVDGDPLETDHDHAHVYPSSDSENDSVAFDIVDAGELKKRIQ